MRDYDLEVYSALLKRPAMFLGTNDWDKVDNFIRSYGMGSKWECNFMNILTNQINHKYVIPMPGEGLIKQLKIAAKKENLKWHELFISETKDLLLNESDKKGQFRFKQILERKIIKYFDEIPKYIDSAYFINLNQINRQFDDWHGLSLPLNQIELFKKIRDAVLKESTVQTHDKIEMSKKTKDNIIELKVLINNER